jgi:hypothetical protein
MPAQTPRKTLATLTVASLAFAFVACVAPASEPEESDSAQDEAVLSQEELDKKYRKPGDGRQRRRPAFQNPSYGTVVGSP